jgi:predicted dehydrogenase/nucleoside-diphosphate-sugar epimerase
VRRVCLVGAGSISRIHAEALRGLPGISLAAVVDPRPQAAAALARDFAIPASFANVADALAAGAFDAAHVLVPPDRHASVATAMLEAGKPVLVEKPLADSTAAAEALVQASGATHTALGVNQNFVFHPAFVKLRNRVEGGTLGQPDHVQCTYSVPLRQLQARQFGHWMFAEPGNILLEQAVHPLSQVLTLTGAAGELRAIGGRTIELSPGVPFCASLDAVMQGARLPASLRFAVGRAFPFWQISVVCDDGVAVADILANRCYTLTRSRWMEAVDGAVSGSRAAAGLARDSLRNTAEYALSTLKLRGRSDPFFRSMADSIRAFHAALDAGRTPPLDGRFGATLVAVCERLRDAALPEAAAAPQPRPAAPGPGGCDIAVLGGTGFIGAAVVRAALAAGLRVAVMARSVRNLPAAFHDPRVVMHQGDIADAEAVAAAIAGAPVVVNLAHGGGGGDFAAIRAAMVGGAETVARACIARGVRLVHVGSIAALYLGRQATPITGATPPDPQAAQRGDYARAKAECDRTLLAMAASEGLRLVILRPGVVVGVGGPPFHSGIGLYQNEQHCIGWNAGRNPLPFVLVDDVADAILRAARTPGIEGRAYNLVGDVRLSARDYTAELAQALGRPLRFHPQPVQVLLAQELGKWGIKRATGRRVPPPTLRDLRSRGMEAAFDTTDAQRDLDWHPVADRATFLARAIAVQTG